MALYNDSYGGKVKSVSDLKGAKSFGGGSYAGGGTSGFNPSSGSMNFGGGTRGGSSGGTGYGGGTRNFAAPDKNANSYGGGTRSFADNPLNQALKQSPARAPQQTAKPGDPKDGENFLNMILGGMGNVFNAVGQNVANAQAQQPGPTLGGVDMGQGFSPFSFDAFNYKGPSVDDILAGLLEQYGGVFDKQETGLKDRKQEALDAIEKSYAGAQDNFKQSQKDVDARYLQQKAEQAQSAEAAQESIQGGASDTQARQAQLAKVLGVGDAVNNSAANEDAAYYAARQAADDKATADMLGDAQTRDFNANQNAITTTGLAAPEMQMQSRGNYDAALDELGTARNQFEQAAYQNALQQYNNDRNFSLGQYQTDRDTAFQNWNAENQFNQAQQNAAAQAYQDQANQQWQANQNELDRQLQAGQAQAELDAKAAQGPDLSQMTNEEQLLQRLQDAGVTPQGSTRWYNDLLNQVSQMPQGQKLTPQMITDSRSGSSQAESYLVDYARKMGWL